MNLKTHSAYSEISIGKDTGTWSSKVYDVHGKVLEQSSGKAASEDEARAAAVAFIASVESKYRNAN